uniref:Uncharacterized protein n=1 Tax=Avena sativa TaxID=4498 RepID=A0ACD5Y6A2_AVESA
MEDKLSEHFSSRFIIPPTNGPAYVNEMLRQNMLAHEATFRKQVSELHHLYKVQKDLMACRTEELNGHSQGRSYPSPSGGIRRAQQVGPPVGHDMKKQSENFMKGKNLASLRDSNSGSTKRAFNIQVPADACADDSDDDMVMMWEEPVQSLPRNNCSVLGTNVKLNIEGSSGMNKNGMPGLQPSDVSTVNVLGKEVVGSSSTMKRIDFPSVGASSSQNQCYSLGRMNLNLPSLEENLEEKHVSAAFGSKSVAANEETRHSDSYSHKKDDRSNCMEWSTHKKNGVDSSTAHYLSSSSISNPQIFAASSSNAAFKSQWKSSSTDYMARRPYADAEMHFSQNDRLPTFQEYCGLHSSEIPAGGQYQKHSPSYDCTNDVNLNNGPRDANTTLEQASKNTPMEISWVRNKLLNMRKEVPTKKSQAPSSCANGHSLILPGSMAYSEGSTRIFGCTVSAATERDSQRSSTVHMGTDITLLIEGVANMQIQCQNKKDDTNVRNLIDLNVALPSMDHMEIDARQSEGNTVSQEPDGPFIDLNVALPFMDDMVMDACQSEGDAVPQEPDNPFNEALDITAAKNLMAMHKDEIQAGSPQLNDILHWFADLAITGENTVVHNSESNNDDNSEALAPRQFEPKDRVTAHRSQPKSVRARKTSSVAASTFNASYKANSSTATPPEDRYPKGHDSGTQKSRRRPLCNSSYKANSSTPMPPEGHYSGTLNARQRSLRSFRGKK